MRLATMRTGHGTQAVRIGALDLSCAVDGTLMQSANTSDLVFSPRQPWPTSHPY
jgi:2-keto-4-pentenoate hydratase/2-oxohepta-3-ene-1,7-dioic acid hydratase in catechol pathway